MAALAVCASDDEQAEVSGDERSFSVESKWGSFNGEPVTKWNPDGRTMTLLTELRYTDPQGFVWVAPIDRLSMAHPSRATCGRSWADHSKENIGMPLCCTTSLTGITTVHGRIVTDVLLRNALQRRERDRS